MHTVLKASLNPFGVMGINSKKLLVTGHTFYSQKCKADTIEFFRK